MSIVFYHGLQQGPVSSAFEHIVQDWNKAHPESEVSLIPFTLYGEEVNAAFASDRKEGATLVLAPEFAMGRMIEAYKEGKVIAMNEILSKETLGRVADVVKRTFGDANGRLLSLPLNPSCGVLFINRDMMKHLGKDPDKDIPKTFEELEKLCQDMGKGYTTAWPAAYLIEIPAAQQDLALVEPDNGAKGSGAYCFNREWVINHILDLREQGRRGIYLYVGKTSEAKKPFLEGKVAFFCQGSTHYPILQKEADFEVGCAPLPLLFKGGNKESSRYTFPLGGAAIWVLNTEKTQIMIEGVRQFLNYLASDEIQEKWHKETAYVPVSCTLPPKLEDFYKDHPVHKAVITQTLEAMCGRYSFGIKPKNYDKARKELFDVIEKALDLETPDSEVSRLFEEFDAKYSQL